ncbi:hypothetical protein C922_05333 [Plasmodium inui San Antonio 1]|uniref:Uncharacterized protein n=1 Tax=Plasmodium inui San Antonio 1 TaxID=1237626 RepID=W6ZY85_9APIC|nr:hypothetical protein C922_05333 [Plasmodium inui San Antonio 1]EUD64288.1 hypothetical protein C922_05333 [Plasmodium inui San Antonio 1]
MRGKAEAELNERDEPGPRQGEGPGLFPRQGYSNPSHQVKENMPTGRSRNRCTSGWESEYMNRTKLSLGWE